MSARVTVPAALILVATGSAAPVNSQIPAAALSPPASYAQWASACTDSDEWDKAGPPFSVWGPTYYVGTCGIAAILIEGEDGHVLIDGGTGAAPDMIAANIEALGFKLSDVKLLLASHEHFDHVGGLAELQRRTGARLLSSPAAAPVLESGVTADDDPQAGTHEPFAPARVDGVLKDGQPVRLGSLSLTPVFTPGHTHGAISWQWPSCIGHVCQTIVYADSLSPVSGDSYQFSGHPDYLADYRASLDRLAALRCSVLLTPHPAASDMRARLIKGSLVDRDACKDYATKIRKRLDERLAKESDG